MMIRPIAIALLVALSPLFGPSSAQDMPDATPLLLDLIYGRSGDPSIALYDRPVVDFPTGAIRYAEIGRIDVIVITRAGATVDRAVRAFNIRPDRSWPVLRAFSWNAVDPTASNAEDRSIVIRSEDIVQWWGGGGPPPRDHFSQYFRGDGCAPVRLFDNGGGLIGGVIDHLDHLTSDDLQACLEESLFTVLGLDPRALSLVAGDPPSTPDPRFAALALLYGGLIEPGMPRAAAEAVLGLDD